MKRFLVVFLPSILVAAILIMKPPAFATDTNNQPVVAESPQANLEIPVTTKSPIATSKNVPTTKAKPANNIPKIKNNEDDEDYSQKKPAYGGHDDDD